MKKITIFLFACAYLLLGAATLTLADNKNKTPIFLGKADVT